MNIGDKIVAAIICLVLVLALALIAYEAGIYTGIHNANESACESVGGVYVDKTCLDVEVISLREG